jgi:hypothetical protein
MLAVVLRHQKKYIQTSIHCCAYVAVPKHHSIQQHCCQENITLYNNCVTQIHCYSKENSLNSLITNFADKIC